MVKLFQGICAHYRFEWCFSPYYSLYTCSVVEISPVRTSEEHAMFGRFRPLYPSALQTNYLDKARFSKLQLIGSLDL